jgi:hypothetical protein
MSLFSMSLRLNLLIAIDYKAFSSMNEVLNLKIAKKLQIGELFYRVVVDELVESGFVSAGLVLCYRYGRNSAVPV